VKPSLGSAMNPRATSTGCCAHSTDARSTSRSLAWFPIPARVCAFGSTRDRTALSSRAHAASRAFARRSRSDSALRATGGERPRRHVGGGGARERCRALAFRYARCTRSHLTPPLRACNPRRRDRRSRRRSRCCKSRHRPG
jgi:hypothetical protein